MGGYSPHVEHGYIGDNKEFSVVTTGEITVHFFNSGNLTSVNDNTTTKNYYFDKNKSTRKYVLRTNQAVEITEVNDVVLTDPITVALISSSGLHKEEFDDIAVYKIKINVITANTNIKIRKY